MNTNMYNYVMNQRNENVLTVAKFLQNLWYTCPVSIIRQDEMDLPTPFYELRSVAKKSLFTGNANELRSECYRNILQKEVLNYGVLENTLVIEVGW